MAGQQILRGTSITVTETFQVDGVPADLDSGVPTVAAKYPDGSALTPAPVASGAWTGRTTGQYRIVLDGQAEVTILDPITWTGTIGGKTQVLYSRVEWVGAHLFALAEAKTFDGGAIVAATNAPVPTDQQIMDTRARITDDFAEILGFQPVPRFARETLDGNGYTALGLRHLKAHRLISVTVNGAPQSGGDYQISIGNEVEAVSDYGYGTAFTRGRRNVVVEYVHGDERVDPATARAALIVAKSQLIRSDVTDRATSLAGPEGGTTFLSTAGRESGGQVQWYGLPHTDSVLNRRSQRGFAVK